MKKAILLVNLGTPNSPSPKDVGSYLEQFLMDPDVIDVPWLLRWFLVKKIIVPKRKYQSSENYKKVWTPQGSPLLMHSNNLATAVQAQVGSQYQVVVAMRYGQPSILSVLEDLKRGGTEELLILPLYPQYAEATTGSIIKELERSFKKLSWQVPHQFIDSFYQSSFFIEPLAALCRQREQDVEHWVLSFHGLPERQIKKADHHGHCLRESDCCLRWQPDLGHCYKAHCYATARAIARVNNWSPDRYTVTFQSRLGKAKWIEPYTDATIAKLAQGGVKSLGVVCPSFVSDCLETLEEIALGGRETFEHAGGQRFTYVPCLNTDAQWVQGLTNFLLQSQDVGK